MYSFLPYSVQYPLARRRTSRSSRERCRTSCWICRATRRAAHALYCDYCNAMMLELTVSFHTKFKITPPPARNAKCPAQVTGAAANARSLRSLSLLHKWVSYCVCGRARQEARAHAMAPVPFLRLRGSRHAARVCGATTTHRSIVPVWLRGPVERAATRVCGACMRAFTVGVYHGGVVYNSK